MVKPVRLFVETTFHAAFRYGGWGFVREAGGAVSGGAGGERSTTAARIDLMALIGALDGLPAGEDLDLWARALKAVQGRVLTVRPAVREPRTPAAFCFAWAEVGQDKAKLNAQGKFSAAIPKVNLATLAV